jgi:hypothetical protein
MTMLGTLELIGIFLAVLFVLSQMIFPALTGGQYFWIFRKDQKKVASKEEELSALRTQEEIIDLDTTITREKERLNEKILNKNSQPNVTSPEDKEK